MTTSDLQQWISTVLRLGLLFFCWPRDLPQFLASEVSSGFDSGFVVLLQFSAPELLSSLAAASMLGIEQLGLGLK
ncbi:hypothetical protein TIFTF001_029422 [Ficus carica]|uniref:Uncharacterized protein n=1 Tax=Ficus carica TaxID=3494 RepID=A0AA88DRR0_FICCA|nr:hypothetical protein TIFTF001_029422 [Ficus carica]